MFNRNMFYKPKPRKTVYFILCALILAGAAAWFALSPFIEKREMLARQNDLLDSIERGDGAIPVDDTLSAMTLDFYYSGDEPGANEADSLNETVTEENSSVIVFYEDNIAPAPAPPADSAVITGIGVLTVEKINAKLPVTDGVSPAQLKVAVGHVPQTAPIGGEGNAVIAGHRSYTYGQYFNRLDEVEPGDIIKYQPKNGGEMAFEVFEIITVLPDAPAIFEDFPGERVLTLHTCTPLRVASHRLLVRAKRIY